MKLTDFDQVITLAKNEISILSAVRYGKIWKFYCKHVTDDQGYEYGLPYNNKQAILNATYNYALKQSGFNFKESDLFPVVPKITTLTLTQDQKVAINTAISLIGNSESDHAGQCYMYLKQITQNF